MFDIGWSEMAFIAVIALIVIGPKDLPKTMRTVSGWVRKARSLAQEFQSGLDDIARESELDELKQQLTGAGELDLEGAIENTIDPTVGTADGVDDAGDAKKDETGEPAAAEAPAKEMAAPEPAADAEVGVAPPPEEAGPPADAPAAADEKTAGEGGGRKRQASV